MKVTLEVNGASHTIDDVSPWKRLLDVLRRARDLSPSQIVTAVFEEVRRFTGDQQRDDVTLIVARCRSRDVGRRG